MISNGAQYITKGQFFRAITVKGAKTYLVSFGVRPDGFVYFAHAGKDRHTDRAKITKHTYEATVKAIESGDLEPISRKEIDPEKMGLLALGLTGLAKGMKVQEYMDRRETGDLPPDEMPE